MVGKLWMMVVVWCVAMGTGGVAQATIPYTPVAGPFPGFGPDVIAPSLVGGKEYSHDFDSTTIGAGAVSPPPADPQQVVAWDGIGGATDVTDFTGTRPLWSLDQEIDALANHGDYAYSELRADEAHLLFSVDDSYVLYSFGTPAPAILPAAGPITLGNGNVIGGAGEISYELGIAGPAAGNLPDTQALWAKQAEINGMPLPDDIDGLEVWGPEPPLADANKYSLDVDAASVGVVAGDSVAVWNASGSPYVLSSAVITAVTTLLGAPSAALEGGNELINIDALMVQDIDGEPDLFGSPAGGDVGDADEILFSIRQIYDPGDPDGYYATGSEIFYLKSDGTFGYLAHGGHLWDHAYSLAAFNIWPGEGPDSALNYGVIDINAIEAVGEFAVPEPTTLALLAMGGVALLRRRHA